MNMLNTPTYIYKELVRRGVEVEVIDESHSLMRYRYGDEWRLLRGCVSEGTGAVSSYICGIKTLADKFAAEVGMPVPASEEYQSLDQAQEFMKQFSKIVVKPIDAAHGNGISVAVSSKTGLKKAISSAKKFSRQPPLLQQMVEGKDVRILIIGGKFAAAVRRVPATVIGDGVHSIQQLIEAENSSTHRSSGKRGRLKIISLSSARDYLKRRISRIPAEGEVVPVVGIGNTSLGGHAEDFTDQLPAKIYKLAEKLAKSLSLPLCGIDILLDEDGDYHFLEINASPGFGPHHHPRVGQSRNVTKLFVDNILK